MSKSAVPAASQVRTSQSAFQPKEAPRLRAAEPKSGHLAQLATLMNDSPRVQELTAMSAWMNPNPNPTHTAPAQRIASEAEAPREGQAGQENPATISSEPDGVVQRKILVNGANYAPPAQAPQPVREAADDEFLRYYESQQEVTAHLDTRAPTPFGLIKPRALWYRIPFLSQNFFVFGESHAAARGMRIKEASNIQKPILDESLQGWKVGEEDEEDEAGGADAGIDENSSKLMRALEAWRPTPPASGAQPAAAPAPALPEIPRGKASTRDAERGTYRLVVYDETGQEAWWKPSGAQEAPPSTHNLGAEVLAAIGGLFSIVFEDEIDNDFNAVADKAFVAKSWEFFQQKAWQQPQHNAQQAYNMQMHVRNYLYKATRAKVSASYEKLREDHAAVTRDGDRSAWTADDYRNEFIFVRILKAAATDAYAFATIGDNHLRALKDRLGAANIPIVTMADFFGHYSQDAVDTHAIARANSPKFRTNERMALWFRSVWNAYPNMEQEHLDMLDTADMGEFTLHGKISKWDPPGDQAVPGNHHEPALIRWLNDIKKEYPNSDDFISGLTLPQVGEFLTTGKIAAWE